MKKITIILLFLIIPLTHFAQQLVAGGLTVSSSCQKNNGKQLLYTLCGSLEALQNINNSGNNYSDMQRTRIPEQKNATRIIAYPNPANQYITIKTDDFSTYYFRIFSLSGTDVTYLVNSRRKVIKQSETIVLDISQLSEGKYIVTLIPIRKAVTRKTIRILKK